MYYYREMECPICGGTFWQKKKTQMYCSRKCGTIARRRQDEADLAEIQEMRDSKKPAKSLSQIAAEARAAGMSYGQYMAMYGG